MDYRQKFDETIRQLPRDAAETGRKVWLAGMGAASRIGSTTSTLFETLVEEGKRLQQRELERVDKVVSETSTTVSESVQDAVNRLQGSAESAAKATLDRLGVPTRGDVAELTARVEALTRRIEQLTPGADPLQPQG